MPSRRRKQTFLHGQAAPAHLERERERKLHNGECPPGAAEEDFFPVPKVEGRVGRDNASAAALDIASG